MADNPQLVIGGNQLVQLNPNLPALEIISAAGTSTFRLDADGTFGPVAMKHPDGTVALPGIAFELDPDTGLYRVGANDFAAAAGGAIVGGFDATGVRAIASAVATPGFSFDGDRDTGMYGAAANKIGFAAQGALILTLDGSVASSATGLSVTSAASGSGVAITLTGGAAEPMTFDSKGTGTLTIQGTATGAVSVGRAVVSGAAITIGSATGRTLVTSVGNQLHMPALSVTDAGVTGTIAVLAVANIGAETVLATNTITYTDAAGLQVSPPVSSTGATFTRTYAIRALGQLFVTTNVQIGGNVNTFGSTQPTQSAVFQQGTAPVGAITTGGAIYTDGTVMKKIIAAGTVSNIET